MSIKRIQTRVILDKALKIFSGLVLEKIEGSRIEVLGKKILATSDEMIGVNVSVIS